MSIDTELRTRIKDNDHCLYLIEADDLIAVWRYKRFNRFKRSADFSRVPTEYRCSAPPHEACETIPCHVSLACKPCHSPMSFKSAIPHGGPAVCHSSHGAGTLDISSLEAVDAVAFAKRNIAPYISPIMDAVTLARVLKELGITGRAVPKVIRGRQYIALSGYAGLRTFLTGTIYSANNRKIIQMAIGSLGIEGMVKSGAWLTIFLTVPLTILECLMKDQATCRILLGMLHRIW